MRKGKKPCCVAFVDASRAVVFKSSMAIICSAGLRASRHSIQTGTPVPAMSSRIARTTLGTSSHPATSAIVPKTAFICERTLSPIQSANHASSGKYTAIDTSDRPR